MLISYKLSERIFKREIIILSTLRKYETYHFDIVIVIKADVIYIQLKMAVAIPMKMLQNTYKLSQYHATILRSERVTVNEFG
jgi:hypothetical protein